MERITKVMKFVLPNIHSHNTFSVQVPISMAILSVKASGKDVHIFGLCQNMPTNDDPIEKTIRRFVFIKTNYSINTNRVLKFVETLEFDDFEGRKHQTLHMFEIIQDRNIVYGREPMSLENTLLARSGLN